MLNGGYKLLYIKSGIDWFPIGCLTNNSFSESSGTLDVSTRDNTDGWQSIVPTIQNYNISFSGIVTVDDRGGTVLKYADLVALKRGRTKIEWKIYSSEGGDTEEGFGYISSISDSASIEDSVSFSGEILGTGAPSTTTWTPPSVPDLTIMIPSYEIGKG